MRPLADASMLRWFRGHYLKPTDDPRASSPAAWPDLRGAAPAILATAAFDPLVDEGDAHARRLREAGVEVIHRAYPSLIHGFLGMAGAVDAARDAVDQHANDITQVLAT